LGGVFYGLVSGLRLAFPLPVTAIFILAAWLLLTRALHFDGFLDTCDGLFGGFTPERRLEIMRDSRVGAFGVAGGGLLLLAKYAAIVSLPHLSGLLLAPVLGRWVLSTAIFAYPYAREKGMGRDMKDNVRWPQVTLATGHYNPGCLAVCRVDGPAGLCPRRNCALAGSGLHPAPHPRPDRRQLRRVVRVGRIGCLAALHHWNKLIVTVSEQLYCEPDAVQLHPKQKAVYQRDWFMICRSRAVALRTRDAVCK
jgi:hypothetical protein